MSRLYRKNQQGYYNYPLYNYVSVWLISSVGVCFIADFFVKFIDIIFLKFIFVLAFVVALVTGLIELIKIIVGIVRNKGVFKYFEALILESNIRKALLNTMTLNLYKDSPVIEVPGIKVVFEGKQIKVIILKLPGMYDMDRLKEDINASFRGRYAKYAITTSIQSDDGTRFSFILTDVGSNKTFVPKRIEDLIQKPYFLKLQEGLIINLSKLPHLVVWGQSGSGKTTVLMSLIAQCLSNNTDLLFLDGKTEFSSFKAFYPAEKIAVDNDEVLNLLRQVADIIRKRQKIVADAVKEHNKIGLTGFDINLEPIVIVGDEIGSIVAGMTTKEKKEFIALLTQVVQKGRSVSVFAILASQSPSVDVLPQGIRSQFSTKILLGSASGDVQRMAFDKVVTNGNVLKYQGYYYVDGLTIEPQKFFVPNLYKGDLANMQVFKKLYLRR